jgi:hypothetical protein
MNTPELNKLEQRAYGATYSDGAIDIFVGLSLALFGAVWILLPDYLPGSLALVAVSVSTVLSARKRFVEARAGYVKFTEPRRRWERRTYLAAAVLLAAFMLMARPLGSLEPRDIDWPVGPGGLIVWLLALIAVALGVRVGVKRMFPYAAVLAATGAVAAVVETSPGWPPLVSGLVIFVVGSVMMRRFIGRHPRVETP